MYVYGLLVAILSLSLIPVVHAQEIAVPVNVTQPCFLNYSAGLDLWRNCGASDDYLEFSLAPWEWVTGGYFSMLVVSLFIMVTYIKYHKAVYPMMIGVIFLPVAFFLFPDVWFTWAMILTAFTIGILIWYGVIKQTKEY